MLVPARKSMEVYLGTAGRKQFNFNKNNIILKSG